MARFFLHRIGLAPHNALLRMDPRNRLRQEDSSWREYLYERKEKIVARMPWISFNGVRLQEKDATHVIDILCEPPLCPLEDESHDEAFSLCVDKAIAKICGQQAGTYMPNNKHVVEERVTNMIRYRKATAQQSMN